MDVCLSYSPFPGAGSSFPFSVAWHSKGQNIHWFSMGAAGDSAFLKMRPQVLWFQAMVRVEWCMRSGVAWYSCPWVWWFPWRYRTFPTSWGFGVIYLCLVGVLFFGFFFLWGYELKPFHILLIYNGIFNNTVGTAVNHSPDVVVAK